MSETPNPQPVDPGLVKYLRLLVTALTSVMIIGFVVIVFLFVTKFSEAFGPKLPDQITLPDGTVPSAFTRGDGWYAVVTGENEILIFNDETGELRQTIQINLQD
ncbi:MAG: DUF6476 family protein, partial [Pseudomonadota bacterium]